MLNDAIGYGKRVESGLNDLVLHAAKVEMQNAELKNLTRMLLNKIMAEGVSLTQSEANTIKQKSIELGVI